MTVAGFIQSARSNALTLASHGMTVPLLQTKGLIALLAEFAANAPGGCKVAV